MYLLILFKLILSDLIRFYDKFKFDKIINIYSVIVPISYIILNIKLKYQYVYTNISKQEVLNTIIS